MKNFELRVKRGEGSDYSLVLDRRHPGARYPTADGGMTPRDEWQSVACLSGMPRQATQEPVTAILKQAGYRRTDAGPFELTEELGVRLGLLMLAVKPIKNSLRIADISERIQMMADEEVYYWFSKVSDRYSGQRAQKAFRILFSVC